MEQLIDLFANLVDVLYAVAQAIGRFFVWIYNQLSELIQLVLKRF